MAENIYDDLSKKALEESKESKENEDIQGIDDKSQELIKVIANGDSEAFEFDSTQKNQIVMESGEKVDVKQLAEAIKIEKEINKANNEIFDFLSNIDKLKETQEKLNDLNSLQDYNTSFGKENLNLFKENTIKQINENKTIDSKTQTQYLLYTIYNKQMLDYSAHINQVLTKSFVIKEDFSKTQILEELKNLDNKFTSKQETGKIKKDENGNDVSVFTQSNGLSYYSDILENEKTFSMGENGDMLIKENPYKQVSEWQNDMNHLKFSAENNVFDFNKYQAIESKLNLKRDIFQKISENTSSLTQDINVELQKNKIGNDLFKDVLVDHYKLNKETGKRSLVQVNVLDGITSLDDEGQENLKKRLKLIMNDNLDNTSAMKNQWMNDTRKLLQEESQSKGKNFGDMSALDYISFYKLGIYGTENLASIVEITNIFREKRKLMKIENDVLEKFNEISKLGNTELSESQRKDLTPLIQNFGFKNYDDFSSQKKEWLLLPENENKTFEDYVAYLKNKNINSLGQDGLNIKQEDISIIVDDFKKVEEAETKLNQMKKVLFIDNDNDDFETTFSKNKINYALKFELNNDKFKDTKDILISNYKEHLLLQKELVQLNSLSSLEKNENTDLLKNEIKNKMTKTLDVFAKYGFNINDFNDKYVKDENIDKIKELVKKPFDEYQNQKKVVSNLKENSSLLIISFFKTSAIKKQEQEIETMNLDNMIKRYSDIEKDFSGNKFKLIEKKLEENNLTDIETKVFFDQLNGFNIDLQRTKQNLKEKEIVETKKLDILNELKPLFDKNESVLNKEDSIKDMNKLPLESKEKLSKLLKIPLKDGNFDESIDIITYNEFANSLKEANLNLDKTKKIINNIEKGIEPTLTKNLVSIKDKNISFDQKNLSVSEQNKVSFQEDVEKIVNKPDNLMTGMKISKLNANIPNLNKELNEEEKENNLKFEKMDFKEMNQSNQKMVSNISESLTKLKSGIDSDKSIPLEQKDEMFKKVATETFEGVSKQSAVGHVLLATLKSSLKDNKITSQSIVDNFMKGSTVNYEEGLKNILQTLIFNKEEIKGVLGDMQKNGDLPPYITPESLLGTNYIQSDTLKEYQKSFKELSDYMDKNGLNYDMINIPEFNEHLVKLDGNLKSMDKRLEEMQKSFIEAQLADPKSEINKNENLKYKTHEEKVKYIKDIQDNQNDLNLKLLEQKLNDKRKEKELEKARKEKEVSYNELNNQSNDKEHNMNGREM